MSKVKIVDQAELLKLSEKDLRSLLNETLAAKAHLNLLLKAGHDKKSDTYQNAKVQVARIKTILNNLATDAN
jgi:ribosomal protein L29